jgi:integrase/recombinase XerD
VSINRLELAMKSIIVSTPEMQVIDRWGKALIALHKSGELSEASPTTYQHGMNKFMAWLHSNQIPQVSPSIIRQWIASLRDEGDKPSSINTWLAGVRNFYNWADENGIIKEGNPTAKIKGIKRPGAGKKHLRDKLTDREVIRILAQPNQSTMQGKRDYAWLCLMAYSALRTIEINRADLEDLSTGEIMYLRVQGKGSNEKDDKAVIYHPKAQEAMYSWLAARGNKPGRLFISLSNRNYGQELGLSAIRKLGEKYFKQAGILDARKTLHSFRHSAISKVAKHDLLKAKQMARHSDINTTLIYVHESDRLDNPGEQWITYQNGENGN